MEPSLNQVLGNNTTQDSQKLTISKSDLSNTGLTVATTNSPESLVVAILLKAANYLNANNQQLNPDIQVTIQQLEEQSIVTRNGLKHREVTFVITLRKPFDKQIDPDNY